MMFASHVLCRQCNWHILYGTAKHAVSFNYSFCTHSHELCMYFLMLLSMFESPSPLYNFRVSHKSPLIKIKGFECFFHSEKLYPTQLLLHIVAKHHVELILNPSLILLIKLFLYLTMERWKKAREKQQSGSKKSWQKAFIIWEQKL